MTVTPIEPFIHLAGVSKSYGQGKRKTLAISDATFDEARDRGLVALDARHLFAANTTRVAVKRGAYLRGHVFAFITTFAPTLTRAVVARALASAPGESFEI